MLGQGHPNSDFDYLVLPPPFFGQLGLVHNVDQLKYTRHPTCLESSLSSVTSAKYLTLLLSTIQTTKFSATEN